MKIIQTLRTNPDGSPNITTTYVNLSEVEPVLTRTLYTTVYSITATGKYMIDDLDRLTKLDDEAFKMMAELQQNRRSREDGS